MTSVKRLFTCMIPSMKCLDSSSLYLAIASVLYEINLCFDIE